MSSEAIELLMQYDWPGNIRELEHFIENIMVRTSDTDRYLRIDNIPEYILDIIKANAITYYEVKKFNQPLQETLDNIEQKIILQTLEKHRWNVTKTAEELGVTRQSLIYRMRKLNINRD